MEANISESMNLKQLSGKKKKRLYSKINSQMEFYFSDSNLAKDKFLQNLIDQDSEGFVNLEVFKTFNKLKALTEDVDIIIEAVSKSNILKVNDEKTKIKRTTPIGTGKDFDACTLYVEKLPSYADHMWLKDVFEHFGVVDHVNIPRFKASQKIKGFAFVEFSDPESVRKACEHYKNSSEKKYDENEKDNAKEDKARKSSQLSDTEKTSSKKRKIDDSPVKDIENVSKVEAEISDTEKEPTSHKSGKKRKHESSVCEIQPKKSKEHEHIPETSCDKDESQVTKLEKQSEEEADIDSANDTEMKSKHRRKHKKKKHERPSLRVMSKYEWKSFRNRYLSLQRSTMSHIKRQIMLEMQELKEQDMSSTSETIAEPLKKGVQFQPSVILKVILKEPIENATEIKEHVKANANVAYIDAPLGHSELFLRCHDQEEAQAILQSKKLHNLGSLHLLQGNDEQTYWQKIEEERKAKFSNPLIHKKRGRDKLIAKASKLAEQKNKHIFFDE